jgi:hypothetical protein
VCDWGDWLCCAMRCDVVRVCVLCSASCDCGVVTVPPSATLNGSIFEMDGQRGWYNYVHGN